MVDTTIINKLNLIYKFISDKSIIMMIIILMLFIIMDLMYGKNNKQTKLLYTAILILIFIYGLFTYYKPLLNVLDTYITYLFKITYFPSIIEYMTMIIITIIIQIYSLKKLNKVQRNINFWIGIIIEILFITNIIALNNINIDLNNITSIYENDLLLSIFQLSSIIFMIWIIYNLLTYLIKSFIDSRIEMPKLNDYYE